VTSGGSGPDHPPVRSAAPAVVGAILSAMWIAAAAFGSAVLAAAVATAAIAAGVAAARRRRSRRRALTVVAACIGLAVAALLAAEILLPVDGARGLWLQLLFVAVLAPIVPAVYAWTFEPDGEESKRSDG